jgi:hypothetical protein
MCRHPITSRLKILQGVLYSSAKHLYYSRKCDKITKKKNLKHSLLSLMTEEERKLTGKVVKSEIESGGETTMVALELLGGERERPASGGVLREGRFEDDKVETREVEG